MRCGYSGPLVLEWENEEQMADYMPGDWREKKKSVTIIEGEKSQKITTFLVKILFVCYLVVFTLVVARMLNLFRNHVPLVLHILKS
jgi:hypothetical protein